MSRKVRKKSLSLIAGPILLLLAVVLILVSTSMNTHQANADQHLKDNIKICYIAHNPPWSFMDESNHPNGILIDYWNLLSAKTGLKISFVPSNQPDAATAINTGRADVLAGIIESPDRRTLFPGSNCFFKVEVSLFVSETVQAANLAQLKGLEIGVVKGDSAVKALRTKYPFLLLRLFPDSQKLFESLEKKQISAFVQDTASANYNLARIGLLGEYQPAAVIFEGGVRAVLSQSQAGLSTYIDNGRKKITDDELEKIRGRWALPATKIPDWFFYKVIAVSAGVLMLLFFSHTLILKIRVKRRTAALAQTVTLTKFQKDRLEKELARRNRVGLTSGTVEGNLLPVLEEVRDAMGAINLNGVLTYINPAGLMVSGFREKDLVGRHCCSFLHKEQAVRLEKLLKQVAKGKRKPGRYEVEVQTQLHGPKKMIFNTAIMEKNGLPEGLLFIARETTSSN